MKETIRFKTPEMSAEKENKEILSIKFVGTEEDAYQQYEVIDHLNEFGWKTLGVSADKMREITSGWDETHGIIMSDIPREKAGRLISILEQKFKTYLKNFKIELSDIESADEVFDAPDKVKKWYEDFSSDCDSKDAIHIANSLCMMGVESATSCRCEPGDMQDPVLGWIHKHHQLHNKKVWEILKQNNLLEAMKKIYEEDSKLPESDGNKIATPPYDLEMVNYFLTETPNSDWVN